jgi:autotransporter-associated beta strand protein
MRSTILRREGLWRAVIGVGLLLGGGVAEQARADVLAGWDFSTLTGGSSNYGPSPMAATTSAAAITVGGLTRGPGVGSTTLSGAARAWGGNSWNGNATLDAAITAGDFITFSFTPTSGYAMSFSDVAPYNVRRSSSGPTTGQWQYQVGAGTFTDIGTPITWGSDTTATGNLQPTITLSGIGGLQNIAAGTSVTFRIVNWNASGSSGTWYLNSQSTTADLDFVVNGVVDAVGGANLFWNGADGWGTTAPGSGGSGAWSDGGSWDSAQRANFGGTAGTVTLGSVSAANGIALTANGYVLTGGQLSLTGTSIQTNAISVSAGNAATLASAIQGSTGLTKTGGGTLTLAGANDFSGGLRIQSGTLAISSASALGAASNAIEISGGALSTTASIDLGSRSITGADGAPGTATLAVPAGATLSTTGNVNLSSLTLPAAATIDLNGANLLGNISATATSGTTRIEGNIDLGTTARTIEVAAAGTLVIDGVLTNNSGTASGTITKQGPGTLVLTQNNAATLTTFRIGISSGTTGGTVKVSDGGALGTNQTQFNHGTIEATAPITIGGDVFGTPFGGLSVGGRTASPARLAGDAVTVPGTVSMFATGSAAPVRLVIDNATTFSGIVSGGTTGSINGLSLGGTGSLRITANASALTAPLTLTDSVRVSVINDGVVSGGGVVGSSLVTVGGGASLGGNGTIGGVRIDNGGTLTPGLSPGVLTTTGSAVFASGGNYNWQLFNATGTAGTEWDLLAVGGALDIAATSADPFRINLWTLSGTGPDVNGSAANFDSSQDYTWTIASTASGITGFSADKFVIRTSATNGTGGFANSFGTGTFSVAQSGNNLNLVFTRGVTPSGITITVASGTTQTQTQAGYPTLSGSIPVVKTGGGTLVLTAANTLTGSTTVQQGTLQLANAAALGSSKVIPLAGGTVSLAAYLQTTVGGLDPNAGGLVDLANGLVTVASGLSPTDLVTAIVSGRGDGSWTGTSGITSSVAASDVASSIPRSVGWLDNGDGSVTAAFAAPGDTNLDWQVDVLDASNFLSFGKFDSGLAATWLEGDFNYDGVVDVLDAADFFGTGLYDAGNYNSPAGSAGGIAAVPEPSLATAGLLAVGVSLLLARRQRSRV